MRLLLRFATGLAAALLFASTGHAQLFRAYLSIDGNDGNPCTVQQPCRLLPRALSVVADGGEVWMLDSANYNTAPVAVDKSVTILAVPGAVGSIVANANSQPALSIAPASPGASVTLRNLVIVPFPGTLDPRGIEAGTARSVVIDRCALTGGFGTAIAVRGPSSSGRDLLLKDSLINGATFGVYVFPSGAGRVRATITESSIYNVDTAVAVLGGADLDVARSNLTGRGGESGIGVNVISDASSGPSTAHIAKSVVARFSAGVQAAKGATDPFVSVSVVDSELAHNTAGALATGGATIALGGSRLVHNVTAADVSSGGVIYTSGTNYFAYNGNDGAVLTGPGGLK